MTARVLVVDDNIANVKLLAARLRAEYFEVLTANSGQEALDICGRESIDVVLLDVMMPGMDGFEVCRRLKADPRTRNTPVVMVTALDQPSDRIQGLEAGADDFLTKPVSDIALMTRVRNLARVKQLTDELVMRIASTRQGPGAMEELDQLSALSDTGTGGTVLLVEDREGTAERIQRALQAEHAVLIAGGGEQAEKALAAGNVDLAVISLDMENYDPLRLCSQIRSHNATRHLPIMVLSEQGDEKRMIKALDLGINDYVVRPVDRNELLARTRTQIKRRRYSQLLYKRLEERVEQAARDPLTGMFNRRSMDEQLERLIQETRYCDKALSVIMADIDHFKSVNDTYGHDNGDQVLRQFGSRLLQNIRHSDLAFRIGGEEFVVVLPKTGQRRAHLVGERLRAVIEGTPFKIADGSQNIEVTTSLGLTCVQSDAETLESLLKRADEALYEAKKQGRNRMNAA